MATRLLSLSLGLFLLATLQAQCAPAPPEFVRFNTSLGNIDVELLPADSPKTVTNFLSYVNSSAYTNSIIHRSVPSFVIQGGGYDIQNNTVTAIPANAPVVGEHLLSNTRGTIAMALSTGPNSGTNEWFFNLVDNSALLDGTSDGGPFTAFGVVANTSGLDVMDALSNVPIFNFGSPFDSLPLLNYNTSDTLMVDNFVFVNSITVLTQEDFPTWQSASFTTTQLNSASISGPAATPQNDGVPNLLKYFYDIDPTRPMSPTDRAALPVFGTTTISGTQYLTLTYRQYALMTGVTLAVQTSSDLKNWTPVTNPTIVSVGTDSNTATADPFMQVQIPASGNIQFIRLSVTH